MLATANRECVLVVVSLTISSVHTDGQKVLMCTAVKFKSQKEACGMFVWVGKKRKGVRGLRGFCQRLKHTAARLPCRLWLIGH